MLYPLTSLTESKQSASQATHLLILILTWESLLKSLQGKVVTSQVVLGQQMNNITAVSYTWRNKDMNLREILREASYKLMVLPRGISKTPTLKDLIIFYNIEWTRLMANRHNHRPMWCPGMDLFLRKWMRPLVGPLSKWSKYLRERTTIWDLTIKMKQSFICNKINKPS